MNLSADLLPGAFFWIANLVYFALLAYAAYKAPWQIYRADPQKVHVFLGACVLLLVLWQMDAGLRAGLSFHLLGGTLFVLMFGWEMAFLGLGLVLLGTTLNKAGDVEAFALNGLIMTGVPIFLSYGIYRFAVRFLPHHFFVYVMANGFFCGGLAMLATVAVASTLLSCCSPYVFDELSTDYLPFAPLMIFAEAFFTGMLTASLALFRPDWITTFDDRRYLSGK